ncbi:hypothetical protein L9F63_006669 [Diploptera punctata]|uniref:Uncharacterized protein n=1 Tax=Diploptera punctata TaxID=6984 RepID=A0AAD7Z9L4_DIPPU|nr:hypothetical protein L9F63_006669 [Diploptera punctata]
MLRWAASKVRPIRVDSKLLNVERRVLSSKQTFPPPLPVQEQAPQLIVVGESQTVDAVSALPESTDVVIVGGGSAGCHTLYQLTKRGVSCASGGRDNEFWYITSVSWYCVEITTS